MSDKVQINTKDPKKRDSKAQGNPQSDANSLTQHSPINQIQSAVGNQALNQLGGHAAVRPGLARASLQRLLQAKPDTANPIEAPQTGEESLLPTIERFLSAGSDGVVQADGRKKPNPMITAGWTPGNYNTYLTTARTAGIAEAVLETLKADANFCSGTVAMLAGGWLPASLAYFVAGALNAGMTTANLGTLTNTVAFGNQSGKWVTAGFTATELGEICAHAMSPGAGSIPAGTLVSFLGTANASTAAFAVKAIWSLRDMGLTIGYCRTAAGALNDNQLVLLLQRAALPAWKGGPPIAAASVWKAVAAQTSGSPDWSEVLTHLETFQANWVGPRANADQAARNFFGTRGPGYWMNIALPGERITHVEAGHTFEYHQFTYGNCTRPGVGVNGSASFFALGTDVTAKLVAMQGTDTVVKLGEAAWFDMNPITQFANADYKVGVLRSGGAWAGPNNVTIYPAKISQYYPKSGATQIVGRDLVAIGRIMGQIG